MTRRLLAWAVSALVMVLCMVCAASNIASAAAEDEKKSAKSLKEDFKLTVYLQKDLAERGILITRFGGAVGASYRTDKFSKTDCVISSADLRKLIKHSTDNGSKPQELLGVGIDRTVLERKALGVDVSDPKIVPVLHKAIKSRFKLEAPFKLNLIWDGDARLFMDVEAAK